jgi:hypothetical protein
MYLNEFRAVKCFLEKIAMLGTCDSGVTEYGIRVQGAISKKS